MRKINTKSLTIYGFIVITTISIIIFFTQKTTPTNSTYEFSIELQDSTEQLVNTRNLIYSGTENYNLILNYNHPFISHFKILLLIDDKQYDLDPDSTNDYLDAVAYKDKATKIQIDFSNLEQGHHHGIFIIQCMYTNEQDNTSMKNLSTRFSIDCETRNTVNYEAKNNIESLIIKDYESNYINDSINKAIEFAVFHGSNKEDLLIKKITEIKHTSNDCFYVYINNELAYSTPYFISVLSNGQSIYNTNNTVITIPPNTAQTFKAKLDISKIEKGNEITFIAIPNPTMNFDKDSYDQAWKNKLNIYAQFSETFIIK